MKNNQQMQKDQEKPKNKRLFSWFVLGSPISSLAQAIEGAAKKATALQRQKKESSDAVEAPVCEGEEAVAAFAEQTTPPAEETDDSADADAASVPVDADEAEDTAEDAVEADVADDAEEADDSDEEEDAESEKELSFHGFGSKELHFVDVMEEPEAYRALKEREARGEIALVTRYRRTFESRLALSDDEIRRYYSVLKNRLLSYRGVKARVSRNVETYNKGRINIAKLDIKSKSLYIYLGMDTAAVAALEDGKYKVRDCSGKKKFASVPTQFKIRGPRKLKYALELIDHLCSCELAIEKNKKFKEQDYAKGKYTEEQLIREGFLRMLVAEIPCEK